MVKTVGLPVTNYKGEGKMDPQTVFNCIQVGQLLRAGGFNPSDPLPPTNRPTASATNIKFKS